MPKHTTGSVVAVCTRAISVDDALRSTITQTAPTDCIQVPTLETNCAIHSARNVSLRSGVHADARPSGTGMSGPLAVVR